MHIRAMIATHPKVIGPVGEALIHCIEECYTCAQTCAACADACLAEEAIATLRNCIRLNLDCADICLATASIASRQAGNNTVVLRKTIEACAIACRLCAEECMVHAPIHKHCGICAEECRACERACNQALASVH